MMAFIVRFTVGAHEYLRALHAYIAQNDSKENADRVAQGIVRAVLTLKEFPERGAHLAELLTHGVRTYRQIFFKPYRIIYQIRASSVLVAVIAVGRRDMAKLLARRLRRSQLED